MSHTAFYGFIVVFGIISTMIVEFDSCDTDPWRDGRSDGWTDERTDGGRKPVIESRVHKKKLLVKLHVGRSVWIFFSCGHATVKEALPVGPSVCRFVGPSVRRSVTLELKTQKRVLRMLQLVLFVCECVGGGMGCGWGEAEGWMPLPTRLQRYCDPASLVYFWYFYQFQMSIGNEIM